MRPALARSVVAALVTLVAAAAGCGSSSDNAPTDAGAADVASERLVPSCPGDDLPSGACAANATCSHAPTCGAGVQMVCNTRWTCRCADGSWACAIAPGSGFGCVPCPGAEERDGGADVAPPEDAATADAEGR